MTTTQTKSIPRPPLSALKQQAKRLRAKLSSTGKPITHSESLELIADQMGFRDWNTLHAAMGNQPARATYGLGDTLSGRYLGQPFTGEVIAAQSLSNDTTRLTIKFVEPIDVVKFDSFSAFRQRVSAVVNRDGVTLAKTSDGIPQLMVDQPS